MKEKKVFPEGMIPLGDSEFFFDCNLNVQCFTFCCKNVDMILYPFDIIKLKNSLSLSSGEFLRNFTILMDGENSYFPSVKLKLSENNHCPFLVTSGCSVYIDRPTACRSYPLERAVERSRAITAPQEYYFMTHHGYCLGHKEHKSQSVKSWLRNQRLFDYNMMNDLWTEMDTLFSSNPWKGEGIAGEKQKLAFMVCYNIDGFRKFIEENSLLNSFRLSKDYRRRILKEDTDLLKFGFEWLKLILAGNSSLIRK